VRANHEMLSLERLFDNTLPLLAVLLAGELHEFCVAKGVGAFWAATHLFGPSAAWSPYGL